MIQSKQPSPSRKAINRSLTTGRKRVNPCEDANLDGNGNNANYSVSSQQSPFRTPPSLSYYHDKVIVSSESYLFGFHPKNVDGKLLCFKILIMQDLIKHC